MRHTDIFFNFVCFASSQAITDKVQMYSKTSHTRYNSIPNYEGIAFKKPFT